jgi:hypothetical protein
MRITKFLTVREGLTGPEEAPFAATPRQNCQKIVASLLLSVAGAQIISHDKEALTLNIH